MKHLSIFIIFLMLTLVFAPCITVRAETAFIPHEDPTEAQSVMDSYSFLAEYADIFALMSNRQYENASRLSEQLSHITVPEDLSYVINRYNQLTQELIGVLNDLQSTLDSASTLLDQYRLSEAGQALDHAGVLVAKAQILLGALKDATLTLSQRIGIFAASVESKVRQAYDQLQSMLQRLNDLINQYHLLLQRANQRIEEIKSQNLDPTTLSLTLNTTKCFVGGCISASGALTSNGQTLENRAVKLLLDGKQVTTTNTQANGTYYSTIKIPYKYVDSISVSAIYAPEGDDQGVYLAALSPTIKLNVLFYKTILTLSIPNVAYPGLSLTISGNVTSQDGTPLNHRQVQVLLDDAEKSQVKTDQTGIFTAKFTIEPQTKIGKHSLTVSVEPEGLYAGTSEQRTITIQKMATNLKINSPSFILLPAQLQIGGTVNSASGPLKDATIQLNFANTSATIKTLGDGSFNLTMDIPLNTAFAGYQELTVKAQPSEPWQATAETKASIFTLNSISTSLALASSLSVFAVTYFKFGKNKKKEKTVEVESTTVFPAPEKEATVAFPSSPEIKFEGIKGKILKAYIEASRAVKSATGDSLTPNMTLREYLELTGPKITIAADPFSDLTTLAERSLYSPYAPRQEDSEKAENIANAIRRILSDGST